MQKAKGGSNRSNTGVRYVCDTCHVIFVIRTRLDNPRKEAHPFCVNCGENTDTRREDSIQVHKAQQKKEGSHLVYDYWTEEEMLLIDKYFKGRLTPSQIANITGRNMGSIWGKIRREKEKRKKADISG